jgi:predicted permease
MFSDWLTDARVVLRGWRRSRGFSATIVLTLVLGLGLASAIFAFADGYLFRPLPFPGADRTYFVSEPKAPIAGMLRFTDTLALRSSAVAHLGFVEWTAGHRLYGSEILIDGRAVEFYAHGVSQGFRRTLAIPLVAGRDFTDDDHREGGPVPVWISNRFWTRELGGSHDVIGREFEMRGSGPQRIVVVGIMGPAVASFDLNNRPPDAVAPEVPPKKVGPMLMSYPLVRLPDDMSVEQAVARISSVINSSAPASDGSQREVRLRSLTEIQLRGGKPTARVLFAGAMLVLLLATINLVHLLLTRGVSRAAEIATRAALGASSWRLSRLFLTESLMFGIVGIAGGLLLGSWVASVIEAAIPRFPTGSRNMALVPMQFDWRVMTFAAALGLVVSLLGGVWPARRALRGRLAWSSRTSTGVSDGVSARLSRSILASEFAVASVVVVGTVFIGLGIWRYLNQSLGFEYRDRLSVFIEKNQRLEPSAAAREAEAALRTIRTIPGVRAASSYYGGMGGSLGVEIPGVVVDPKSVGANRVTDGFFEAWGLRVLAGRWFTQEEFSNAVPVAVVDGKFASLAWGSIDAVGRDIRVGAVLHRVVGVVEHQKRRLSVALSGRAVVPAAGQAPDLWFVAWAPEVSASELRARLESALRDVVPFTEVRATPITFEGLFLRDVGEAQFQAPIMIVFGVLAFVLAGIGVFGLVSYLVEQRTREFGIRFALGARPSHVWQSVIRQSLVPAIIGLVVGAGAAWALETVVRSSVFGWQSSGAVAVTTVFVALLGVAVLAAAVPARRAMRIDPAVTLRSE